MSFLGPLMLLGVLGAAVPVIIHLFNRSRYRVVKWGAMHLLDPVVRVNRKRLRVEQLILLVVRAAIPAAIALFMARPVITGWRVLPGNVNSSLVAAIDNSYSMEAGGGDQSNFARAKQEADRILSGLARGSDAAVVAMAGGHDSFLDRPTSDVRRLRKEVRTLGSGYGVADAAGRLEKAIGLFARMGHEDRELVVLSDFQRLSWGTDLAPERRRTAAIAGRLDVKPHVTLFRVGREYRENISVDSLSFSRFIVGVGQKVRVRATIKNHGDTKAAGLRVHFRVDGKDRETSEIPLGPREQSQVMFSCAFETPGSHVVEVSADADPLAADNRLLAALPVWDTIEVLLASGKMGRGPLEGATDYLEAALEPFASARMKLSDLIRTRVVDARRLRPSDLRGVRVAVLADVEKLDDTQVKALEDFLRTGGGLLVFAGEHCDIGWYNAVPASPRHRILPARFGPVAGSLEDPDRQTTVVGEHFDHETLALFNNPRNGTIAGGRVRKWLPLQDASADGSMTVLARLATGDPFLVEGRCGAGRVIVCATSCHADWSSLPLRPVFLPLVQQLVTYLASTVYPPRNVEVGDDLAAFLPAARAGGKLTVKLPDGTRRKVTIERKGSRAVATYPAADRPGLYVMEGEGIDPVHFVVNTTREESRLEQLTDGELSRVAAELGADVVTSGAQYETLRAERRHGRGIWRYVFWLALLLVFSEMFLQQVFSRRKVRT